MTKKYHILLTTEMFQNISKKNYFANKHKIYFHMSFLGKFILKSARFVPMSVKFFFFYYFVFPVKISQFNCNYLNKHKFNLIIILLHQKMMKFLFFLYYNENKARFVTKKKILIYFSVKFVFFLFFSDRFFFIFEIFFFYKTFRC